MKKGGQEIKNSIVWIQGLPSLGFSKFLKLHKILCIIYIIIMTKNKICHLLIASYDLSKIISTFSYSV